MESDSEKRTVETSNFRQRQYLVADREALERIFHRPEDDPSRQVLTKYMEQIQFGLHDFLRKHVGITEEIPLNNIVTALNQNPVKLETSKVVSVYERNGMVFFKDPCAMEAVAYHASYIKLGSGDLGIRSLPGSRCATSLVLGSARCTGGCARSANAVQKHARVRP